MPGSDKSTKRGGIIDGWPDVKREGIEDERQGWDTAVCSLGELLSEGGAE